MIGWVPHVIVDFLDEIGGPEIRRAILADAGLDAEASRFALHTDVPDPACRRMIEAACARLGVTETRAFELFAPFFLTRAKAAFPGFFRNLASSRDLLLRQPAIHNSLATGLRDPERRAVADKFRVEALPRGLRLHYRSSNRMAGLYVAVARQVAADFGERAVVTVEAGSVEGESCTMRVDLFPLTAEMVHDGELLARA